MSREGFPGNERNAAVGCIFGIVCNAALGDGRVMYSIGDGPVVGRIPLDLEVLKLDPRQPPDS